MNPRWRRRGAACAAPAARLLRREPARPLAGSASCARSAGRMRPPRVLPPAPAGPRRRRCTPRRSLGCPRNPVRCRNHSRRRWRRGEPRQPRPGGVALAYNNARGWAAGKPRRYLLPVHEPETFPLALSYDDVLIVPRRSGIPSRSVPSTVGRFSRRIELATPIVSANMDTVTESAMAVAMAQAGGLGVIHRFLPVERHALEVATVARAEPERPSSTAGPSRRVGGGRGRGGARRLLGASPGACRRGRRCVGCGRRTRTRRTRP